MFVQNCWHSHKRKLKNFARDIIGREEKKKKGRLDIRHRRGDTAIISCFIISGMWGKEDTVTKSGEVIGGGRRDKRPDSLSTQREKREMISRLFRLGREKKGSKGKKAAKNEKMKTGEKKREKEKNKEANSECNSQWKRKKR